MALQMTPGEAKFARWYPVPMGMFIAFLPIDFFDKNADAPAFNTAISFALIGVWAYRYFVYRKQYVSSK